MAAADRNCSAMKRNEKILAGILGLSLVGYFVWKSVVPFFVEPVALLQADRDALLAKVSDQQLERYAAIRADRDLSDSRKRGLPGNDLDAQRLYQQWLTELALGAGLEVTAKPGVRRPVGDIYTGVQVSLEGTATFDELQTFLRRFRRTDLLHRIYQLDLTSPAAEGDPRLRLVMVAEGLNIEGTPPRSRLFPQIMLTEKLEAETEELVVDEKELKPRPGDWLRIGSEFATVTAAEDGRLQLARGSDGTTANDHGPGTKVELLPGIRPDQNASPTAVVGINSPFVKPREYAPQFDGFSDLQLVRGTTAEMSVEVTDYDRGAGEARLELIEGPEGLTFDAATGDLTWTPGDGVPAGRYPVTLAADVPAPQQRLEQTVSITLSDPNTAPTLAAIPPEEVFLGEYLEVALQADDAEGDSLDFRIDEGPSSVTIDRRTGTIRWRIPESFPPGEVDITVVVSDEGDPPLSAERTLTVTVLENFKPFVHLSGTWLESSNGPTDDSADQIQKQAFLYDRSQNLWHRLREGRDFEAAGLKALVKQIESDSVTYVRNGEIWKLRVGAHLGDAEKIGDAPVEATLPWDERSPIEASRPEPDDLPVIRDSPSTAAADPTPPK